jgi:hypothetical protein
MPPKADTSFLDSPVVWFVELERARARHDYDRASESLRQLRRLGVIVRFLPTGGEKRTVRRV